MSFREIIDTASALALSEKLYPDEIAVWERYCRDFSTRFSTPLMQVREMNPFFVIKEVNADNLSELNPEEQMEHIIEMIGVLSDPDYDIKKERAIREEMRGIEEREEKRLKEGRAIHSSLEKDKRVIAKEEGKELPKSGGINMGLINSLNNKDREG